MRNPANNQDGFTFIEGILIAILAAILAALIFGTLSAGQIAHAKKCENSVITIQGWNTQWEQSRWDGNPDIGVCNEMNVLIDNYNGRCGADFGNMPKVKCTPQ